MGCFSVSFIDLGGEKGVCENFSVASSLLSKKIDMRRWPVVVRYYHVFTISERESALFLELLLAFSQRFPIWPGFCFFHQRLGMLITGFFTSSFNNSVYNYVLRLLHDGVGSGKLSNCFKGSKGDFLTWQTHNVTRSMVRTCFQPIKTRKGKWINSFFMTPLEVRGSAALSDLRDAA